MNKSDLVSVLRTKFNLPKEVSRQIVNTIFSSMAEALCQGEHVTISEFGSFELRKRPGRVYTDPHNRHVVSPDREIPSFKASRKLRDVANRKTNPAAK